MSWRYDHVCWSQKSIGGAEVFSQGKTKFKGLYDAISRNLKLLTIAKLVTSGGPKHCEILPWCWPIGWKRARDTAEKRPRFVTRRSILQQGNRLFLYQRDITIIGGILSENVRLEMMGENGWFTAKKVVLTSELQKHSRFSRRCVFEAKWQ